VGAAHEAQHGTAAGQQVAPGRELAHEATGDARRRRALRPEPREQAAEALDRELGLGDLAAPVAFPELVVDRAVVGEDAGRERQTGAGEGAPQGGALGAVEVEEGLVGVEEDAARPGQERPTWRGR
jgi:hypothetical protein